MFGRCFLFVGLLIGTHDAAQAQGGAQIQEDYAAWELLKPEFGSTGGGGVIIRGYAPVVSGSVCTTDFTATEANGTVYENSADPGWDSLPRGQMARQGWLSNRHDTLQSLHQGRRVATFAVIEIYRPMVAIVAKAWKAGGQRWASFRTHIEVCRKQISCSQPSPASG